MTPRNYLLSGLLGGMATRGQQLALLVAVSRAPLALAGGTREPGEKSRVSGEGEVERQAEY